MGTKSWSKRSWEKKMPRETKQNQKTLVGTEFLGRQGRGKKKDSTRRPGIRSGSKDFHETLWTWRTRTGAQNTRTSPSRLPIFPRQTGPRKNPRRDRAEIQKAALPTARKTGR